ncbi:GntR family transcriptional regulator [Citrobacter sp. S2-9]|uniref:GntR family transcriptional regulator n=1 Tax=Citrobacter enshiensis TaxID=2971264 RepID=A0ABT8PQG3_9ENTR|nr:GntR family transcriptional regulator [Citrobacter enshiensis]MDN8598568.1 GntR family transcriptional regulator [Citrobacter enshiensis]
MPGLERTSHISLTTQVENGLKHQLTIGALKPGARLITKNIAHDLGISITPVREALLRLVSASALAVAPAQAFMVPDISLARWEEINHVRTKLEGMAVAAAAETISAERLQTLTTLLEQYQQAHESGTIQERLLANHTFRFEIYRYANMPTLYQMIEQLWVRMGPSLHFLYGNGVPDGYQSRVAYYHRLLDALAQGDKEECRQCLNDIIAKNVTLIRTQYLN